MSNDTTTTTTTTTTTQQNTVEIVTVPWSDARYSDLIKVKSASSGLGYTGHFIKYVKEDPDFPHFNGTVYMILPAKGDDGDPEPFTVRVADTDNVEIVERRSYMPKEIGTLASYYNGYVDLQRDLRIERKATHKQETEILELRKSSNQEWDTKIKAAFAEAKRRGYCSEVEEIAKVAGIEVPKLEKYYIRTTVNLIVLTEVDGYDEDHAKGQVTAHRVRESLRGNGQFSIVDFETNPSE